MALLPNLDVSKHPLYAIDLPVAKELAEYTLIRLDIENAIDAIKICTEKYPFSLTLNREQVIIRESLFRDAVVQFVACFDPKNKLLTKEAVYANTQDGLKYFQWLLDLRDTYAAHNFGPQRQCIIGVVLLPGGTKVLHERHQYYAGPQPEHIPSLLTFMQMAADFVRSETARLGSELMKFIMARSPDELMAAGLIELHPVPPTQMRTSRRAFQRSRAGQGATKTKSP